LVAERQFPLPGVKAGHAHALLSAEVADRHIHALPMSNPLTPPAFQLGITSLARRHWKFSSTKENPQRKRPWKMVGTVRLHQWQSLRVYVTDGRLKIDNHPAEQAIRPLAVGRRNWLHIGGDGGLQPAAVLLSLAASAKRHALNPWEYFKHILAELPARPPNADLTDLLPDVWARSRAGPPTATD
jgi:Transposase IS66 family/IS66 C-terminal element